MNNYEWLKTLSPEQIVKLSGCNFCSRKTEDNCIGFDCDYFQTEWLNEEHKE